MLLLYLWLLLIQFVFPDDHAGASVTVSCHSRSGDSCAAQDTQMFSLPELRPIALRVSYVDRKREVSHS